MACPFSYCLRVLGVLALALAPGAALRAQLNFDEWIAVDVGAPATPMSATAANDCLVIDSAPNDIIGPADEMAFVYREMTGNQDLRARLARADGISTWGKIGVMAREDLDPASRSAYSALDFTDIGWRYYFARRAATASDQIYDLVATEPTLPPDVWIGIQRQGALLIGLASLDGSAWFETGRHTLNPPAGDTLLFGFAVSNIRVPLQVEICDIQLVEVQNLSPVAAFTVDTPHGEYPHEMRFDASASVDPDGAIAGYSWDFGDGEASTGKQTSHTYAFPGNYVVTLTVSDGGGNTASTSQIVASVPKLGDWLVGDIGLPAVPTLANGENDCFQVLSQGIDIAFAKDQASFLFQELTGDFTLQSRVTRADGIQSWGKVGLMARESLAPSVRFGLSMLDNSDQGVRYWFSYRAVQEGNDAGNGIASPIPDLGSAWLRLQRDGDALTASYSVDGQIWSESGTHIFDAPLPQALLVGMVASNFGNLLDAELCDVLLVSGTPPQVAVIASPSEGDDPLRVEFSSSVVVDAGRSIDRSVWDFGDGATAEGASAVHVYGSAGQYLARLSVRDSAGLESTAAQAILVRFTSGDVAPWTSTAVGGAAAAAGGARRDAGRCLRVFAGGEGIAGASDQFHFVQQSFQGDVVLSARVAEFRHSSVESVGLMLRESLDPNAAFVGMFLRETATPRFSFQRREKTGGVLKAPKDSVDPFVLPNAWIQIERKGSELIGSFSADGAAWTELSRVTLTLPETLYGGIAATSRDRDGDQRTVEALVCDLTHDAVIIVEPIFRRGDADANGSVELTDAVSLLNYLFTGGAKPACFDAADFDDNGEADISDAIANLNYQFLGGSPPHAPGPEVCGVDAGIETPDLGCAVSCR